MGKSRLQGAQTSNNFFFYFLLNLPLGQERLHFQNSSINNLIAVVMLVDSSATYIFLEQPRTVAIAFLLSFIV